MRLRRSVRPVVPAVGALVLAAGSAGTAHASATGSTAISSFDYAVRGATIKVPVGCFLTHTIKGSGKRITSEFAGVDCMGVAATFSRFSQSVSGMRATSDTGMWSVSSWAISRSSA